MQIICKCSVTEITRATRFTIPGLLLLSYHNCHPIVSSRLVRPCLHKRHSIPQHCLADFSALTSRFIKYASACIRASKWLEVKIIKLSIESAVTRTQMTVYQLQSHGLQNHHILLKFLFHLYYIQIQWKN